MPKFLLFKFWTGAVFLLFYYFSYMINLSFSWKLYFFPGKKRIYDTSNLINNDTGSLFTRITGYVVCTLTVTKKEKELCLSVK